MLAPNKCYWGSNKQAAKLLLAWNIGVEILEVSHWDENLVFVEDSLRHMSEKVRRTMYEICPR